VTRWFCSIGRRCEKEALQWRKKRQISKEKEIVCYAPTYISHSTIVIAPVQAVCMRRQQYITAAAVIKIARYMRNMRKRGKKRYEMPAFA
jgi:hypothetical protein